MLNLSTQKTTFKNAVLGFLLFAVIISVSIYGFYYSKEKYVADSQNKFNTNTNTIESLVNKRIQIYINALYNTKAFVSTIKEVDASKWKTYMENSEIFSRYPGIFAISYIERVFKKDRQQFISSVVGDKSISSNGFPQFTIHPESNNDVSYIIKYIEPLEGRQGAFGLDWTTDPIRREALNSALESGNPRISRAYTSASTGEFVFGAIIPVETDSLGVKNLVLFTFNPRELFTDILHDFALDSQTRMEIFQPASGENPRAKIYDTNPDNKDLNEDQLTKETEVNFLGQKWVLKFTALGDTTKFTREEIISYLALIMGILLGTACGILLNNVLSTSSNIKERIVTASAELQAEKKRLEIIFDSGPDAVLIEQINESGVFGNFLNANNVSSKHFGYSKEEFLNMTFQSLQSLDAKMQVSTQQVLENLLKTGTYTFEMDVKTKTGGSIPVEIKSTVIDYEGKKAAMLIVRDVSEKVLAKNQLNQKLEELEKLNKLLLGREVRMVKMKEELEFLKSNINEEKS